MASALRATSPLNLAATASSNPQWAAATQPITGSNSLGNSNATRISFGIATSAAKSLAELIAVVPADYRNALREPITWAYRTKQKLLAAQATLGKWREHQAKGTLPPHLRGAAPKVQFSKSYVETAQGQAQKQALADQHTSAQKAALTSSIRAKADEVRSLGELLTPDNLLNQIYPALIARCGELDVMATPTNAESITYNAATRRYECPKWGVTPDSSTVGAVLKRDPLLFMVRAIRIAEQEDGKQKHKSASKKSLHQAVDVEMADATTAGPSIQSLVDKAVAARLKKLPAKVSTSSSPFGMKTKRVLGSQQRAKKQKSWQKTATAKGTLPSSTSRKIREINSVKGEEGCGEGWTEVEEESDSVQEKNFWKREGEGQRKSPKVTVAQLHELRKFKYGSPSTIPDWLLSVPYPLAISYLLCRIPLSIIEAARYKSFVHISPGVVIPENIALDLSVGLKYMLKQDFNKTLVLESYNDFCRRLRWRLFFSTSIEHQQNTRYDPDFETTSSAPKKDGPLADFYIERGLTLGRRYIEKMYATFPGDQNKASSDPLKPKFLAIQRFLQENELVISLTDKNLGLAVNKRSWCIEQCNKILSNTDDYMPITQSEAYSYFIATEAKLKALSDQAENLFWLGDNLGAFLLSNTKYNKDSWSVPQFYGIPKIHKQPVKFRPIIPCHSAIQNPAAKFCSKYLKGLIQASPTIIHGSKDLAQKLSKIILDPHQKCYIVTGDVVAFYPNIPLAKCKDIVCSLAESYIRTPGYSYSDKWDCTQFYDRYSVFSNESGLEKEFQFFRQCLDIGNDNLICQFQGQHYRQLRGLAMGVADSPDLANLYGSWFEEQSAVQNNPRIPFYGRYIDDCLALVYASSETEAFNLIDSLIQFDDCTIEWSVSEWYAPFLDMLLYFDEDRKLQHQPYRKAHNHMERLPWISYHPLDVKRGTFLGEMSRLATLSSTTENYKNALKSLAALYIHRGYPAAVINHWLKTNTTERWNRRLDNPVNRHPEGVHVLKTVFNSAWGPFNPHKLQDTIYGYWTEYLRRADSGDFNATFPHPLQINTFRSTYDLAFPHKGMDQQGVQMIDLRDTDILGRQFLVSRKRTKNLFDLTRLWNKVVSEQAEARMEKDRVQDVGLGPYKPLDVRPIDMHNSSDTEMAEEQNPPQNMGYYAVRPRRSSPDRWGAT